MCGGRGGWGGGGAVRGEGTGFWPFAGIFCWGGGVTFKTDYFFLGLTKFSVFLGGIVRIVVGTFC